MMHVYKFLIAVCVFIYAGCSSNETGSELGRTFYNGNVVTQDERISTYSLSDQWEIYYYGKTFIHPPDFSLSKSLAKNGEVMAAFIINSLTTSSADMYFLNSLDVIQSMKNYHYYDYCENRLIVEKLQANRSMIKNSAFLEIYNQQLAGMKC